MHTGNAFYLHSVVFIKKKQNTWKAFNCELFGRKLNYSKIRTFRSRSRRAATLRSIVVVVGSIVVVVVVIVVASVVVALPLFLPLRPLCWVQICIKDLI